MSRPPPKPRTPLSRAAARRLEAQKRLGIASAEPAVARWFWTADNARRPSRTEALGAVARRFVESKAFKDALRLADIREAWNLVVPDTLAPHCEPQRLRSGRLTIAVDDPSAKFLLERDLGGALLSALRAFPGAGHVRELLFVLEALDGPSARGPE